MTKPIIGILGGGQLGMMLCDSAKEIDIETHVFCPDDDCPSKGRSTYFSVGEYSDEEKIIKFSNSVDFITYEFENIPIKTIDFIKDQNKIRPGKQSLLLTQDRLTEKRFLDKLNIPIAPYKDLKTIDDVISAQNEFINSIVKTRTLGYDGKGQFNLRQSDDPNKVFNRIVSKSIIEKRIPFEFEVSVIIGRDIKNNTTIFPIGKNIHENHILKHTFSPTNLSKNQINQLIDYSEKIVTELDHIGVLAVEFFITKDQILVNEIAPRVHNSGHLTINAFNISQFENHVRAVCDLGLKKVEKISNAEMFNVLGKDIETYRSKTFNKDEFFYDYGKKSIKDKRKMGHLTVLKK